MRVVCACLRQRARDRGKRGRDGATEAKSEGWGASQAEQQGSEEAAEYKGQGHLEAWKQQQLYSGNCVL